MRKTLADFGDLLRQNHLRATPGRIALLQALCQSSKPLTVAEIQKKLGLAANLVTLYRALPALVTAGLVRRVDFQHAHAHYEFAVTETHHHHVICKHCGIVEDVAGVEPRQWITKIQEQAKRFKAITNHSMEFFGICTNCAA